MKKDSSEVAGPCGGTRLAQGENVNMQFLENADRTPVNGTLVHDIQSFAKSIWQGFYDQGMAPKTWGSVSRAIKDKYICKMETRWPLLRYCDNHWKVNHLATQTYSQWFRRYKKTKALEAANAAKPGGDKPAAKKRKITTIEPDSEPSPPPEEQDGVAPTLIHKTSFGDEDIDKLPPPQVKEQQPIQATTSRPRARPLQNPL